MSKTWLKLNHSKSYYSGLVVIIALVYIITDMALVMYRANTLNEPVVVDLTRGSSIRTLAAQLEDLGVLDNKTYFIIWARVFNISTHLQAGEYLYKPDESLADLLDNMVDGKVRQYLLTLVEGWTFQQFIQEIKNNPAIKQTLDLSSNKKIMEQLGYAGEHPEGRFFPDTYYIHKNINDSVVLKRAHSKMSETLLKHWTEREQNLPFKNSYEALILASIVEKESAVADERPVIAGVFINRLRKKMRLQTDPTVIYGMGDRYKGDIRFRDLRRDTPYNTYTRSGLPPTPIAMPGLGALKAVMHPANTDKLYFVAISDGSGRHIFTRTLAEHVKQVNIHQRKRRKLP